MEKNPKEETLSDFSPEETPIEVKVEEEVLRPNGSHGMTLNRPFGEESSEEKQSEQSNINFNLTVSLRVPLTARQRALLLAVLNYQACHFGITFNMLLAIWYLYLGLLGSNKDPVEEKDEQIRLALTVSQIILRSLQDLKLNLEPGQKCQLPETVKRYLERGLMTKRTYGSRFVSWRPEGFLEVKTVPVDIKFLERRNGSQPYDSYCKGYGESHPCAHRHKTKFSAELDGVVIEEDEKSEIRKDLDRSLSKVHNLSDVLTYSYDLIFRRDRLSRC